MMLMDDQPLEHESVERALRDSDWRLESVESGEQGLKRLKSLTPAIIFVDQNMLALNGISTIEEIRKRAHLDQTLVFLCTAGNATSSMVAKLERLDAEYYPKDQLWRDKLLPLLNELFGDDQKRLAG